MALPRNSKVRLARTVAMAVIIGIGIFNLEKAAVGWTLSDAAAYWSAAMRLRAGGDLYPALASVDASDVYRYAPWFAWLAVPFTFLPIELAGAIWSAILLIASGVALIPLVRARAWLLIALFLPILVGISALGNVQALLIAWLIHGVERRAGPFWIALAASLKIFPILLATVYAGRRQWTRVAATLLLTLLLWAPALAYDLRNYASEPGQAASLISVPALYVFFVGAGVVITFLSGRNRFRWLSGATAVVLSLPRIFVYDVTYLMLGVLPASRDTSRSASSIE
ncbi:MAG: glycosyltransferase 87 family protein [Chloroflexota bacterium]|nr:glycosyltransferase 87 family protein [Chloroflexota bacterium]